MGRINRPEAHSDDWTDPADGSDWVGKHMGDPTIEHVMGKDDSGRWVIKNRPAGVDPFYTVEKVENNDPSKNLATAEKATKGPTKKKERHLLRWVIVGGTLSGLACICCGNFAVGFVSREIADAFQKKLEQIPLLVPGDDSRSPYRVVINQT